jgi:ABC-2 type transport system permease protein
VVAHLLRLKLALLRNGLRRSVAVLVGMVLGLVYGGGFVILALVGLAAVRFQGDVELSRTVVVVGGSGLMAGWAVLPIILFGVDPTLDPTRFATFAVRERTLAVGLVLTALVGLPGLATVLLVLGTVVAGSWSVTATLTALLGGLLGLLTCVLLSRIVTGAASAVLATRRGRDVAGVGGLLFFVMAGPLISGLSDGGINRGSLDAAASVLAWTPLGWAWAPAGDLAQGDWGAGLARLALAAALCLVLLVAWERLLVSVLRNPRSASADGGKVSAGLGLFGRLPGTPMGAIAARAGTYWVRDPRFNVPAIMTILLPAGLLIPGLGSGSTLALLTMPLASAYLIGWGQHNDVGYDSTAFWMHVASGVDGVSDRLGRLFPSGLLALVCVPTYAVLGPVFGAPWRMLPATFGAGCALALNGFAVACVTSAVKQYAVPAPGENPFTSRPGSAGVTLGVQAVCGAAVMTLSLPALGLAAAAYFGVGWAAWVALVLGPVLGVVALVVGTRLGADLFRRRQALLLQDLVSMR